MRQYRSHKVVEAAKIVRIDRFAESFTLHLEGGEEFVVRFPWAMKHSDHGKLDLVGGYYVRYPLQPGETEQYTSWSPAGAFEAGNTLVEEEEADAVSDARAQVNAAIEPLALAALGDRNSTTLVISQAISARRIADALTIIATAVDMAGVTSPFALNELMENAGHAFALGMRGRG